jgi:hypothetical protein
VLRVPTSSQDDQSAAGLFPAFLLGSASQGRRQRDITQTDFRRATAIHFAPPAGVRKIAEEIGPRALLQFRNGHLGEANAFAEYKVYTFFYLGLGHTHKADLVRAAGLEWTLL